MLLPDPWIFAVSVTPLSRLCFVLFCWRSYGNFRGPARLLVVREAFIPLHLFQVSKLIVFILCTTYTTFACFCVCDTSPGVSNRVTESVGDGLANVHVQAANLWRFGGFFSIIDLK